MAVNRAASNDSYFAEKWASKPCKSDNGGRELNILYTIALFGGPTGSNCTLRATGSLTSILLIYGSFPFNRMSYPPHTLTSLLSLVAGPPIF
jgi:hypothetical protein